MDSFRSGALVLACLMLGACSEESGANDVDDNLCERVQTNLTQALPQTEAPGALLLVRSPEQPDCAVAAGIADTRTGTPATPDQLYLIGSSTKTFVAAAILLLSEDGEFEGEGRDTVEYWLPGVLREGGAVSIAHLLTHTSGLYNYTTWLNEHPDVALDGTPTTSEEIIAIAEGQAREFAPGARFSYCNTNYVLLGMIIEAASGMTWGEFVQQRLLTPLGLEHTYIDRLQLPEGAMLMRSYATLDGEEVDATELTHPSWFEAAGSMVSNLHDMAEWTEALYGGGLFQGETLEALLRPQVIVSDEAHLSYSIGTILKDTDFGPWAGHGGTVAGSLSYMGSLYERGMYVEAVINHDAGDRYAAADAGWRALVGQPLGDLQFVAR